MARKDTNIVIKFGVIAKDGHAPRTSVIRLHRTEKISYLAKLIRLGIQTVNPYRENLIDSLTKLYYPKDHKFLDPNKKLSDAGLRENDFVIITNCDDIDYLDGIIFLKLRDQILDMPKKTSRTDLVIRGLIRGIPYFGEAIDTLLFGKKN